MSVKISNKNDMQWLEDYYSKSENWMRLMMKKSILNMALSLKKVREDRGVSQRKLAKITGIAQSTIAKIEKGHNAGTETITRLSLALGMQPKLGFEMI
jgi:DNA-binding XRE family transcriptional regulator